MTVPQQVTILPQLTVSAAGVSLASAIGAHREFAQVDIEVALIDANGQLDVVLETGLGTTGWELLLTCPPIVEAGTYRQYAVGCKDRLRVRYDVLGSASLSVSATTHQLYCTPEDVRTLSIPAASMRDLPIVDLAQACLAATDEAASYLGSSFDMPLTEWGVALRMHTSNMAAYHALKRRGYDPNSNESIRLGYTDALDWLKRGAKGDASIIDTSPEAPADCAFWVCDPPRGWQRS